MTDRELLKLAAKAANIDWSDWTPHMYLGETELRDWPYDWNPLRNDGDALRLAVRLDISLSLCARAGSIMVSSDQCGVLLQQGNNTDSLRRAITRAAAEIGLH